MLCEETKQKIIDLSNSLIQSGDPYYRSCRGSGWWPSREKTVSYVLDLIYRKTSIMYELNNPASAGFVEDSIRHDVDSLIHIL